jgi:hypothetical protein
VGGFVVVAVLALALGAYWGRFVEHIDAGVERMLLLMCVPAVLFIGWLLGEPGAGAFRLSRKRVAWVWTVATFYVGYGVGWLLLWGHLGA